MLMNAVSCRHFTSLLTTRLSKKPLGTSLIFMQLPVLRFTSRKKISMSTFASQAPEEMPDNEKILVKESIEEKKKNPELIDAPKRKVAVLLAYCGKNYYGLQLNRGDTSLPTIEGAFFNALVAAKVVPEICREKSQQMKYASSSRTDKGVSTCGLVASLKMKFCDDSVRLINEQLPPDIRVLDIRRVTKNFHAKLNADARTYSYTMPTFAFSNPLDDMGTYRITEDKLKHIRSVLFRYKGTHSYHNFTSGKKMGQSSAKRYIIDFWDEPAFVHDSVEFITFKVKGQSFMIHQIRKMIGLMIAMVSGHAAEDHFVRAFTEPLEDIPKAPGAGLILELVHYESYNMKQGHMYGGVDWNSSREKAKQFMDEYIMPVLYKEEKENESMKNWLELLANHDFTGEKAKVQWQKQVEEQQIKQDAANKAKCIKDTMTTSQKKSDRTVNNIENKLPTTETKLKEENFSKDDISKDIGESNWKTASNGDEEEPPMKKLKPSES